MGSTISRDQAKAATKPFNYVTSARKRLVIGLLCAVIVANSYPLMPVDDEQSKVLIENVVVSGAAISAAAAALIVVARQKLDGLFGRAYLFLAVGLVMWGAAEVIWSFDVLIVGRESPFPSIADAFWLGAYATFGYFMANMYRFYRPRTSRTTLLAVSSSVLVFTLIYSVGIISTSELSAEEGGDIVLAISLAYPVLDGLLIIPAILIVIGNMGRGRRGVLTAIPWVFISWILTVIGDSIFGYTAVTNMIGDVTIWDLFYSSAYLCMLAGLIWHNKFFVLDDKKGNGLWMQNNR